MIARILLIEDDPISQQVIAALLESRGHQVDCCCDGFRALRLAQEQIYDLVFVDYHLPEMDGYALARLMRTLGDTSEARLKMVAITSDRFGLAARRGVDTLFDRLLTKPIEPSALFAFVDEILGQTSKLDALEAFIAQAHDASGKTSAGEQRWRACGLSERPRAIAFPAPMPAERAHLEACFQLVGADHAECIILLRATGLGGIEALRGRGNAYLQPLIVLDPQLAPVADISFDATSAESWSATALAITAFNGRVQLVDPLIRTATDFDTRLAAYLFVADRPLLLRREASGDTSVPSSGGFCAKLLIDAIKRLASRGLVSARLDPSGNSDAPCLSVALSQNGFTFVKGEIERESA